MKKANFFLIEEQSLGEFSMSPMSQDVSGCVSAVSGCVSGVSGCVSAVSGCAGVCRGESGVSGCVRV